MVRRIFGGLRQEDGVEVGGVWNIEALGFRRVPIKLPVDILAQHLGGNEVISVTPLCASVRSCRNCVPAQTVDATLACSLLAGVWKPKVFLGRRFKRSATWSSCACEMGARSVPRGKYCLNRRLVFSLVPRCHGLCGSQK
jgi:hypothetical protein